ncbi:histidine phosphatase family protein [Paenibacillus sp. NPDC058174]|uniref:histidine phosphatase family protein n=1 Tax=Paenibacillus sp. NPDC058174 TaxID=3346366 RepID=UPI0036D7C71E
MITTLYLVRHAHSVYSSDEWNRPLSERGTEDALKVADRLKNEKITAVLSSPYKRAIQTVEGLAEIHSLKIVLEEDFRERLLAAEPVDDFNHAIEKVWTEPSFSWEGGESNLIAQERGVGALHRVLQRYEGENIAIGTHGNIMVLIMNALDTRFDFAFWRQLEMPDIYKLSFDGLNLIEVTRMWE